MRLFEVACSCAGRRSHPNGPKHFRSHFFLESLCAIESICCSDKVSVGINCDQAPMIYGSTERTRVPEDLISPNFLFHILPRAFSELFDRWFPRDMQSTLSHTPAETATPIPCPALNLVLLGNFGRFWSAPRDVWRERSSA